MASNGEKSQEQTAAEQGSEAGELRIGDLEEKRDAKEQDDALRGGVIRGDTGAAAEPRTYFTEV